MLKEELNFPISYSSFIRWVKLNNNPTHTNKPVAETKTKPSPSQKHKQTEELDRLVKGVEHIWDPPIEEKKRDDFF